jgi:hypothetical protein
MGAELQYRGGVEPRWAQGGGDPLLDAPRDHWQLRRRKKRGAEPADEQTLHQQERGVEASKRMLRFHVGIGPNPSLAQFLVAACERLGKALAAVEHVSDRSIRAFLAMRAAAFGGIAPDFVKAIKSFIDLTQTNFHGTVAAMKMLPRVLLAGRFRRGSASSFKSAGWRSSCSSSSSFCTSNSGASCAQSSPNKIFSL